MKSCVLSKQLPRGFEKKCQELTLEESTTCTIEDLQSLLSNVVELLVNGSSHLDLDSVAMKVLYLSDIVFQKFERIFVDRMDMVSSLIFQMICNYNCVKIN